MVERVRREHRGGRGLSEYDPLRHPRLAAALCRFGATNCELADALDVSEKTIRRWIIEHAEFAEAVHRGIFEQFSPRVVRSLAQQALGYAVDEEVVKVGKDGELIRYNVRRQYPPNVTACIFWLKNRDPENWRDVHDHVGEHNNLDKLTSKELLDEIRREVVELGILNTDEIADITKRKGTKH
jgi:transposase-like protein